MKIKQVGIRRVFNLGNYETFAIELIADVNETENVEEILDNLSKKTIDYRNKKMDGKSAF